MLARCFLILIGVFLSVNISGCYDSTVDGTPFPEVYTVGEAIKRGSKLHDEEIIAIGVFGSDAAGFYLQSMQENDRADGELNRIRLRFTAAEMALVPAKCNDKLVEATGFMKFEDGRLSMRPRFVNRQDDRKSWSMSTCFRE